MSTIYDIPEVAGWRTASGFVRIPPGVDVPLTDRVRRLIDSGPFRRLARISQLGLVSLVYPAANHSRQEHSLGVYQATIEYLERLAADERFVTFVSPEQAELLLAAALLHDVGHWPFGHPIEDLQLAGVPRHEDLARALLVEGELATVLRDDWGLEPTDVGELVAGRATSRAGRILGTMLSGPIDVDKIDYLMRDSLHAGVPYGHNFDRRRLVGSLCLNEAGDGLAITDKGKTAAEMMVFARYVMFSEVYWHHAVRSATAMLQRAFYLLCDSLDLDRVLALGEGPMIEALCEAAGDGPAGVLLGGLFGSQRQLYKRLAEYTLFDGPELHKRLARRPYPELVRVAEQVAAALGRETGLRIAPHEILVDAPPVELEVDFEVEVFFPKQGSYRRLDEVSPAVRTLATQQFDDYVKRVRVFAHPARVESLRGLPDLERRLGAALAEAG